MRDASSIVFRFSAHCRCDAKTLDPDGMWASANLRQQLRHRPPVGRFSGTRFPLSNLRALAPTLSRSSSQLLVGRHATLEGAHKRSADFARRKTCLTAEMPLPTVRDALGVSERE